MPDTPPDDLTGIFDDLSPIDFIATSVVARSPRHDDDFDHFVERQLHAVRYAFAAADGAINPIATLGTDTAEHMFTPEDDESLGQYVWRLRRQARIFGATTLFIFKKTKVGLLPQDDAVVKALEDGALTEWARSQGLAVDDPEAMRAALELGTQVDAVYWYAVQIGADPRRRHGYITITDKQLGPLVEAEATQAVGAFDRILQDPS